MSVKAITAINSLTVKNVIQYSYQTVEDQILKEFRLSPLEYKRKILKAFRLKDESYNNFASRLKNCFKYYVDSSQVTDDYSRLFDLVVSDQLKEMLPRIILQFIFLREGTEKLSTNEIGNLADIMYDSTELGQDGLDRQFVSHGAMGQTLFTRRMHLILRESEMTDFNDLMARLQILQNEKGEWNKKNGDLSRCQICRYRLLDIPNSSIEDNCHVDAIFAPIRVTCSRVLRPERSN